MKQIIAATILLLAVMGLSVPSAGKAKGEQQARATWQRLPDMPEPALMAAGDHAGGRVVIAGGINQAGQASTAVRLFDLKTRTWQQTLHMKTGRAMHATALLGGRYAFVVGGKTGQMKPLGKGLTAVRNSELIDLQTGKTTPGPAIKQNFLHATTHVLSQDRAVFVAGRRASIYDKQLNDWIKVIALRRARESHTSVRLPNGNILIAGGVGEASIELLDVNTGTSTLLAAKLPDGVDDLAAVGMSDEEVWLVGGQYRGGWTTDRTWIVDLNDPKKATITDGPRLQIKDGVADACVARVDHWIIVAGGESERNGKDTELALAVVIDTKIRKVYALPNMHAPHDDAFSITTQRGMIIFGGYTQSAFNVPIAVPTVEMFEIPKK